MINMYSDVIFEKNGAILKEVPISKSGLFVVPDGVEEIYDYAFEDCQLLTEIIIADSVKQINHCAFKNCTELVNIHIPQTVENIDPCAFCNCDKLPETLQDGRILRKVISSNSEIYSVKDGTQIIGGCAFLERQSLNKIVLPESMRIIGTSAFNGCKKLNSINIVDNLCKIGENAFADCSFFERNEGQTIKNNHLLIKVPKSTIGEYIVPEGITDIEVEAFKDCQNITNIKLPSSLRKIGNRAFQNCKGLTKIIIPKGVIYVGENIFDGCDNLRIDNPIYSDYVFIKAPKSLSNEYTIPQGIQEIASKAFYDCKLLTGVILPNSIRIIGEYAFYNCENLSMINFPYGITEIKSNAFDGCNSLESVDFPNTLKTIGHWAFSNCDKLKNVRLPNYLENARDFLPSGIENRIEHPLYTYNMFIKAPANLTGVYEVPIGIKHIKEDAFPNCQGLNKIILPNTVEVIESSAFDNYFSLEIVFPSNIKKIEDFYLDSISFGKLKTIKCYKPIIAGKYFVKAPTDISGTYKIPDGVEFIASSAFEECKDLEEVIMPNSIVSIGAFSFSYCENLKNVQLSSKLIIIDYGAFLHCKSLHDIVLPDSLRKIDGSAFSECISLVQIKVPEKISKIESSCFENCVSLERVEFPNILEEIGTSAFSGCKKVKDITLPPNLKEIGDNAFEECESITELKFPNGITELNDEICKNCKRLFKIEIPYSVKRIAEGAFEGCKIFIAIMPSYWDRHRKNLGLPGGNHNGLKKNFWSGGSFETGNLVCPYCGSNSVHTYIDGTATCHKCGHNFRYFNM